jgi:hypothetical protein
LLLPNAGDFGSGRPRDRILFRRSQQSAFRQESQATMGSVIPRTEKFWWHILKTFAFFTGFMYAGLLLVGLLAESPDDAPTRFPLVYGGLMTGFTAIMFLVYGRRPGHSGVPLVHQRTTVTTAGPISAANERAMGALRRLSFKNISSNGVSRITARVPISLRTWGEEVSLSLAESGADVVRIEVESRPKVKFQLWDSAKNLENVERIVAELERDFASGVSAS